MFWKTFGAPVTLVAVGGALAGAVALSHAAEQSDAARAWQRVLEAVASDDFETAKKLSQNPDLKRFLSPSGLSPAVPKPDTSNEELKACGFYPQETRLECVIEVKRAAGHGGHVAQIGSVNRVYFCVNIFPYQAGFGWPPPPGGWMPVGWGTVGAHDEPPAPDDAPPPWHYSVYRDFDPPSGGRTKNMGITAVTQTKAKTYRVRAILDHRNLWDDPLVNCQTIPVRGNVLEFNVRADPIR